MLSVYLFVLFKIFNDPLKFSVNLNQEQYKNEALAVHIYSRTPTRGISEISLFIKKKKRKMFCSI